MNTSELTSLLRLKHSGLDWAFVEQVPNGTSLKKTRTADALAMHLWTTKGGIRLHGFEIKVSRSDWQKEMQDVSKSESFQRYCDYWWLVCPEKVAKLEELPANWGLMTPGGETLKVRRPATINRAPEPVDRDFLAGIFRAVHRTAPDKLAVDRARTEGYEHGYKAAKTKTLVRSDEALAQSLEDFEKKSGLKINGYNGEHLGRIVQLINRCGIEGLEYSLKRVTDELERNIKNVRQMHKDFKAGIEGLPPEDHQALGKPKKWV